MLTLKRIEVLEKAFRKQMEINEDMTVLIGMQREMLERHLNRIENLEDEISKHTEELGGQLKIIGELISSVTKQRDVNEDLTALVAMQREMIERMQEQLDTQAASISALEYTVEDLQKQHGFYSDHVKREGGIYH